MIDHDRPDRGELDFADDAAGGGAGDVGAGADVDRLLPGAAR